MTVHTMDTGNGWTILAGTWVISSNAAVQSGTSGFYVVCTDVGVSNFRVRLRIKTSQAATVDFAGSLAVRISDINNLWKIVITHNGATIQVQLVERNASSETIRASKTWTAQFQKYIGVEVECNGNDITAWFDGGYSLTYNSTFNNTATKVGMIEQRSFTSLIFDDFEVTPLPVFPITRVGTVISETGTDEESNAQEPSVIYEGNAQILSGDVFKMWYVHGYATPYICYAESVDGITWTKYTGNPILTGHNHPVVRKFGSIYYLYAATTAGTQIDLYTSSDGITWTLDTSDVIPLGSSGAWDDTGFGNIEVWQESMSDWRALYEAHTAWGTSDTWKLGYATSTDGRTWSKSGSNPVISLQGSVGGPNIFKDGSYYYLWMHRSPSSSLPTSIARYRSTDLVTWVPWPWFTEIHRIGTGEGEDTYIGQVADPEICIHNGSAYIYFSASSNGNSATGHMHIVLATADARVLGGW